MAAWRPGSPTAPDGEGYLAWSPDGTRIVFASIQNGNNDIFVVNVDDKLTRLTDSPEHDAFPNWSPW